LQVHYNKSGKAENDRTKVGLHFAKGAIDKRVRWLTVVNPLLRIPAGANNHTVRAVQFLPTDATAHAIMPHMHLLGKTAEVTATLPDGTVKKLVNVPRWDFNWQQSYAFKEPIKLPKGTRVELVARYDNSTDNPRNPSNPPRDVRWGEQTTDEMTLAFLLYTADEERLTQGMDLGALPGDFGGGGRRSPGGLGGGELMKRALEMFDKNKDGKLDADEREAALQYAREMFGGAGN
jgi:hypothetical protein